MVYKRRLVMKGVKQCKDSAGAAVYVGSCLTLQNPLFSGSLLVTTIKLLGMLLNVVHHQVYAVTKPSHAYIPLLPSF